MRRCYASIPALMPLSVGDLSLRCAPGNISSMSEWTLWHEQWVRNPSEQCLLTFSRSVICKRDKIRGWVSSVLFFFAFVPSLCWVLYSFFACCGISGFFFLWPEAHQAERRDGEQGSCLDTKLFWHCSADSRQTLGCVMVPADSLGQYMRRRFCQEAALALSTMAGTNPAL